MRLVSLGRLAWKAELLRIRLMLRRQAMRIVWAAVAGIFSLFLLAMAHIAAYEFLAATMVHGWAALVVAGADLLLLAIFGLLAGVSRPGVEEREAERISRRARLELVDAGRTFAVVAPVVRAVGGSRRTSSMLTSAVNTILRRRR